MEYSSRGLSCFYTAVCCTFVLMQELLSFPLLNTTERNASVSSTNSSLQTSQQDLDSSHTSTQHLTALQQRLHDMQLQYDHLLARLANQTSTTTTPVQSPATHSFDIHISVNHNGTTKAAITIGLNATHPLNITHDLDEQLIPAVTDRGRPFTAGPDTSTFVRPNTTSSEKGSNKGKPGQQAVDPSSWLKCWPDCSNQTLIIPTKSDKKHPYGNRKFHNNQFFHNSPEGTLSSSTRKNTEFYAWIFGATMLALGLLLALGSCVAYYRYGKTRKKKKKRKRRKARGQDEFGEYERVGSVSSMVSSRFDETEKDDQENSELLDSTSVTII